MLLQFHLIVMSYVSKPELPPQHSLPRSIALHLLPGIVLTVFIVLAAPVATRLGFPVVFALLREPVLHTGIGAR